jgi:hypothetical protein
LCGAATATNALLTDYPGGAFRVLSYKTHGEIDAGLAGITDSLPRVMGFGQDPAAHFFKVQALGETAVTVMTDFGYYERSHTERSRAGLFRPASTAAHHDETA